LRDPGDRRREQGGDDEVSASREEKGHARSGDFKTCA
jgi:hypothetical protein